MPLHKNQSIPLDIHAISSDGNGVGRHQGQVVFVPGAAVGDRLQVGITKPSKTYAYGRILQIVTPGPGRIKPDCPVSHQCGGCQFRHLDYAAELAAKQGFVADALGRLGGIAVDVPLPLASPLQNRYRNKVQYPVAPGPSGGMEYGFYAPRSHRPVPCEDCLLQPQALNQIAAYTIRLLQNHGVAAYNEKDGSGLVRHLLLRQSEKSGQVLLCIVAARSKLPAGDDILRELTASFPQLATVILNLNPHNTNVILGGESHTLYGNGFIEDELCGVPMRLNEHTFAQVNSRAAEQLFRLAGQLAAPTSQHTLLDLYCGTGVIGLSMAHRCKTLIGVEIVSAAVESARQSATQMGLGNTRFICADAEKAARQLAEEGIKPDTVLLDPPRKGAGPEALQAILRMAPKRILMVSCNPATLARDLALLTASGYRLVALQPADLFPRTRHVECLCLLECETNAGS